MSTPAGFRSTRPPASGTGTALVVLALLSGGCTTPKGATPGDFKAGPEFHAPTAAVSAKWVDAAEPRRSAPVPADHDTWEAYVNRPAAPKCEPAARRDAPPSPPTAVLQTVVGEDRTVEAPAPTPVLAVPLPAAPADPDGDRGVLLPDIKDN